MVDQQLTIRTSPSKGAVSKSQIEVGKLRLSPVTSSVSHFNAKKAKSVVDPRLKCTLTLPDKQTMLFSMGSPTVDEHFCSAFFLVAVTHDEELGNMLLQSENVPFILASSSKLKIAGHEHRVNIPIFVNKSIIKKGEELRYFVKKQVGEKSVPEAKALKFPPNKRVKV